MMREISEGETTLQQMMVGHNYFLKYVDHVICFVFTYLLEIVVFHIHTDYRFVTSLYI